MSKKSSKPSTEEIALFRQAMTGVRKLKASDRHLHLPAPKTVRRRQEEAPHDLGLDDLSDGFEPMGHSGDDYLDFSRPGIQKKVLRKFRQGRIAIEAELDLHGANSDQARQQLGRFLERCQNHGQRCVRVIHGKGYGSRGGRAILKSRVNHWLQQHPAVMAFSSAQIADGGTGAVYVLLKRGQESD